MKKCSELFIALDTAKKKHAVAVADVGREGEIRYLGEIDSSPATVERVIGKLAGRYEKLRVCYEAGPTGYGLYRQVKPRFNHPKPQRRSQAAAEACPSAPLPARLRWLLWVTTARLSRRR